MTTGERASTHQWARELKRRGVRTLVCVQFRVPNDEIVLVGTYDGEKMEMTASEAAAAILAHTDPMGLEVIVRRKITPKQIARTYLAPRVTELAVLTSGQGHAALLSLQLLNRGEIRAQRLIREDD